MARDGLLREGHVSIAPVERHGKSAAGARMAHSPGFVSLEAQVAPPMTENAPLPLAGIRVLEFCQTIMGPSCGLVLADLGADVIKVEPAPDGDKTRRLPGFAAGFFGGFNRNKRSLAVDLKSERGRDVVHRLAVGADVVIENYAPGTMERLGCGCKTLREINPGLIFASLKGFLSGPYENRPALDEVVQFMAGLAYMTGPPGRPLRAGTSIIDIMGGSYAVIAILCALKERETTGKGQFVKSALFESTAFLMSQHMAGISAAGREPQPMPARARAWAIYETFETGDGEQVFIGITSDNHWRAWCGHFGWADELADPLNATNESRVVQGDRLAARVADIVKVRPLAEMTAILEEIAVPFSPVAKPVDLFDDPQLNHEGRLLDVRLPGGPATRLPRLPVEIGVHDFGLRRQPPGVGEQTSEILAEAGFDEAEIAALAADGAITR